MTILTAEQFLTITSRSGRNAGPYLLQEAIEDRLISNTVLRRVITDVWTGAEFPEDYFEDGEWEQWFRQCGTDTHIIRDSRKYPRPKRVPTLYRGGHRRGGMAWTADLDVARRFASGVAGRQGGGTIWKIVGLDPSLVLARIEDRTEHEWVIDISGYTGDVEVVEDLSEGAA